jgi:hypothetical protein
MIGVCDVNGFVIEACETIQTCGTGVDVGPINRDRFTLWVQEKLLPVLGDFSLEQSRSIVVLDNATIHHSEEIIGFIESTGAKIVYLPPYSPDLNPIELMFACYKKKIVREGKTYGWVVAHSLGLESVTSVNARNFFRRCFIPVDECDDIDKDAILCTALAAYVYCNDFNHGTIFSRTSEASE